MSTMLMCDTDACFDVRLCAVIPVVVCGAAFIIYVSMSRGIPLLLNA